ncbi:MAG: DUF3822 family protein [Chryseobacterium sp.]|nr:MAG: DUF3822 family protein [Chryseobacterium sp.]
MIPALSILQICDAVVIEKRINFAKMNNNNSILLADHNFDPNAITNRNLLIKITADSFSYALLDTDAGKLEVLYDQQECNPAEVFAMCVKTDPNFLLDLQKIKVSVFSQNLLIIPEALFQNDQPSVYANYFNELDNYSDTLYTNLHAGRSFKTCFLLPKAVAEIIESGQFAHAEIFGQPSALLGMVKPIEGRQLILDFSAGSVFALFFKGAELQFQNSYIIENDEELTYYLLLIVQQFDLNARDISVSALGILNEGDGRYQVLERYFKSVNITEPSTEVTDITILEDMPKHYYTSLLAIDLCV